MNHTGGEGRLIEHTIRGAFTKTETGFDMSSVTSYPHIVVDTDGTARIGDTRYKVQHLAAEHYHFGWSAEELLRQHPDLRPEEVYSALAYFYDHFDDVVNEIKSSADRAESQRPMQAVSRAELLRRVG